MLKVIFLFVFLQAPCLFGAVNENCDDFAKRIEALEHYHKSVQEEISNLKAENRLCRCSTKEKEKRLLMPNEDPAHKIAFDAALSHDLDHSGIVDITITYDSVLTNIGGAYHKDTGVFVAPVKGVYLFTFTIHGGGTSSILASLAVNGNKMASVQADGSGQNILIPSASRTTILSLNKDDRVYIQILHGSRGMLVSAPVRHSSFAGVLLFT